MKTYKSVLYLLIFTFFFSCYALISNGRYGGDGLENYLTAKNIILKGDICIDEPRGSIGQDARRYSSHGIGMPILLIPLFLLGKALSNVLPNVASDYVTQFCVSFTNPILTTFTILLLFSLLSKMGFTKKTSFLTSVCYGFCTMNFVYTRSGFAEPAMGLLLMLSIVSIYRYEETSFAGYLVFVGILSGYALLIKNNTLLYIPLLFGYLIHKSLNKGPKEKKIKMWLAICLPLAVFIPLYFYFHSLMNCGVSATSLDVYREAVRRGMPVKVQMLKGLAYYLISMGKGYFFYNIPLLLALFGIRGLIKKRKRIAIFLLTIILFNLLFYSLRFMRGSIFSWGPRYLYATVPLMCVFLAQFIEGSKSPIRKLTAGLFMIGGFLVQVPCLFVSLSKYLFFVTEQLSLHEYMINFIPDLSPIAGMWRLFISAISRSMTGSSLSFVYNPDPVFVSPVIRSLSGYDGWDTWWFNVASVSPDLNIVSAGLAVFLSVAAIASLIKIWNIVKTESA